MEKKKKIEHTFIQLYIKKYTLVFSLENIISPQIKFFFPFFDKVSTWLQIRLKDEISLQSFI